DIGRRLSQIDVSNLHDAVVILSGDTAVIHLGEEQFLPRLQSYLELAPALRERVPEIDYVDLRFDERIYVKPANATPALRRSEPVASARSAQRRDRPADRSGAAAANKREPGGRVARKKRDLGGPGVGTAKNTAGGGGEPAPPAAPGGERGGRPNAARCRGGGVVNLEAAVDSIKKAIDEAELMAGVEIDSVHLALSGPHIKGFNSRGVIAVAGKNREITREDVRRAIDAAKAVSLPTGREIL